MQEILSIIKAYDIAVAAEKKSALATVVHVAGSSYRRPGARMLITEDGELTGSISGGCLEGDAFRKALHVILSGKTMLVTYDTADDDDARFGLGLGCEGVIQILIEPLQGAKGIDIIDLLRKAVAVRQKAAFITLFSLTDKKAAQYGSCFLLTECQEQFGDIPVLPGNLVIAEAGKVIHEQHSSFRSYQTTADQEIIVFTEILLPPVSLVIVGGGNDVIPLVKMADILGWNSTVVDGRPMYANKERFPLPSCQVRLAKADQLLQHVTIDPRTVFVLMSHNYNYDLTILKSLLDKELIYIGVLGPHKKMKMMMEELESEGIVVTPAQKDRIHGPVGLHIGAETAEEIAVSIIAEIQAAISSAQVQPLRNKKDVIHRRDELLIEKTT